MRIWSFRKMAMRCLCFLRTSRDCGCVYALCLRFHFCTSLLALSSSLTSQFCQFDVATMRPLLLAPLQRTINLRKHTQLQDILLAFLSRMDVCAQATPLIALLKRDGSWGHTPPTESTICKISSLTLRRLAIKRHVFITTV